MTHNYLQLAIALAMLFMAGRYDAVYPKTATFERKRVIYKRACGSMFLGSLFLAIDAWTPGFLMLATAVFFIGRGLWVARYVNLVNSN